MEKIMSKFNTRREDYPGLSDETVALLMIAERLDVIANKASVLDPKQLDILKEKMDEITGSVHGVGEMVRNSQQ